MSQNRSIITYVIGIGILLFIFIFIIKMKQDTKEELSEIPIIKKVEKIDSNKVPDLNDLTSNFMQTYGSKDHGMFEDVMMTSNMLESFFMLLKDPSFTFPNNQGLVEALQGKNSYQYKVLSDDFPYINASGELVDRWKNPLFFHRIKESIIDVRSAGPDGIMWNEDDITTGLTLEMDLEGGSFLGN